MKYTILKAMLCALSILISTAPSLAQATIKGKVIDDSGEPVLFATVAIYQQGALICGTQADFDGNYLISNIQPGTYDLEATYVGLQSKRINAISFSAGETKVIDITLLTGVSLECAVIVESKKKLFRRGKTTNGRTVTSDEISNLGLRSVNNVAATTSGVKDGKLNIRGGRNENTVYFIDGQRVRGAANLSPIQKKRTKSKRNKKGTHDPIIPQPIEWNTEDYSLIVENEFLEVASDPLSTFSIDVDAASYSNVRRFINTNQPIPKDAVRIEEMINYFDYDYPQPNGTHPFATIIEKVPCPWNTDHELLHIGLQGLETEKEDLPNSNIVFLIDVSGSMQSNNKLPLLKQSFNLLIDELRDNDKVAIVVYAGAAGEVLPSTSGSDKETIRTALNNLTAGGSTAGAAGIKLAYQIAQKNFIPNGNNRVILATDGDFNVGTSSDAALVRLIEDKRKSNVFLTVLGFGMGNYKDNKMQQLADKGNGNHAYIDNIREAQKVLVHEFNSTIFAIAKDVKLQLEFNPKYVHSYRLIGYENRLLADKDFNDDKKDAGEIGSGHTVTALYEIIPQRKNSIKEIASVDPLKYQLLSTTPKSTSREVLTLKLRYKKPKEDSSILIEKILKDKRNKGLSPNLEWASAVASFAMILRDSKFKSEANLDMVLEMAKSSKGEDPYGYREEFIRMVETYKLTSTPSN